jgi:hypothetical protein
MVQLLTTAPGNEKWTRDLAELDEQIAGSKQKRVVEIELLSPCVASHPVLPIRRSNASASTASVRVSSAAGMARPSAAA